MSRPTPDKPGPDAIADPWESEPDLADWIDEATQYRCVVLRHPTLRHLCGYVGVAVGHPAHGVAYDNVRALDDDYIDVHGGLTYGASNQGYPVEHNGLWWLGFDCAHSGDVVPGLIPFGGEEPGAYRDMAYVKAECARLAAELAALEGGR